jgi:integrase
MSKSKGKKTSKSTDSRRIKGEGSVYKRNDGRYVGQVNIGRDSDGTYVRKYVYGKSEQEVIQNMKELNYRIMTGELLITPDVRLNDWLDEWLNEYKKDSIKITTYHCYKTNIDYHIKPLLGGIKLSELRLEHIQRFINRKYAGGVMSTALVRKIYSILYGALKQAMINRLINRNECIGVKLPRHEQKEVRYLTKEEEKLFLQAVEGDNLEIAFKLDLVSGLRLGELLGLSWNNVDLNNGVIHVKQTLMRIRDYEENRNIYEIRPTTKTSAGRRRVPIPSTAVCMLKYYKKEQDNMKHLMGEAYMDNGLVFCTELGNRLIPRNVERSLTRIANKIGAEGASVHSLRHTYATRLFEKGVEAKTISELLGHTDVNFTLNTYTHVSGSLKTEAVEKLADILTAT